MKRIYLSGGMSGLPDSNYPAFNAAAATLRAQGYHVENPADNPRQESWSAYMRQALRQMLTCDEVWLLPGWEQSSGAVWEASIADGLGMPLVLLDPIPSVFKPDRHGRHLIHLPAPGALRRSA